MERHVRAWRHVRRWIFPVWCVGCGKAEVALCGDCGPAPGDAVRTVVAHTSVGAAGAYAGVLRRAIIAMKRGERAYLDPFALLIAAKLTSGVPIVPLPTTRSRRAARGFDQAVELARRAGSLRAAPIHDVLEKHGAAQRGLARLARLNSGGRFRVKPRVALPEFAVVVDDVCTTGATLADGITALRSAGVAVIGAVVLAYAMPAVRRESAERNPRDSRAVSAHGQHHRSGVSNIQ